MPGVFPEGKGGRCVRLTTLPLSCAVVTKSGNLNFLGPSGPLRACNGTDLDTLHQVSIYYANVSRCRVNKCIELHCQQMCRDALSTNVSRCTVNKCVEMHCQQMYRDARSTNVSRCTVNKCIEMHGQQNIKNVFYCILSAFFV